MWEWRKEVDGYYPTLGRHGYIPQARCSSGDCRENIGEYFASFIMAPRASGSFTATKRTKRHGAAIETTDSRAA